MSFICDNCGKVQANGTKPTVVVVETRAKHYPERREAGDKGGNGTEIVKQISVCPFCIEIYNRIRRDAGIQ